MWVVEQVKTIYDADPESFWATTHYLTPQSTTKVDASGQHLVDIHLGKSVLPKPVLQTEFAAAVNQACRQHGTVHVNTEGHTLNLSPMLSTSCQQMANKVDGYKSMALELKRR